MYSGPPTATMPSCRQWIRPRDDPVQVAREGDPGEVGDEQDARPRVDVPEGDQRGQDRDPQDYNLVEGGARTPSAEEQDGPEGVQTELDREQSEGDPRANPL